MINNSQLQVMKNPQQAQPKKQHQTELTKGSKTNSKKNSTNQDNQSIYKQLSRMELIKQCNMKDEIINSLKQELKNFENADNPKLLTYKKKLEEELAQNQKAVKAFGNITEIIITIICKFQGNQKANRQSVASMVGVFRQSHGQSAKNSHESQLDQSDFSCLDEIIQDTVKMLQYLSKLAEQSVNINLGLKKQCAKMKSQLSQPKKTVDEQIKGLTFELNQKILQNKGMQKVILQQEEEKKKLMASICQSIDEEALQRFSLMDKNQLISQIKKMSYRIKELQKDKRDIFAKSKVDREQDHKKLQSILKEVKQIKVNQTLNKSAL